MKPTTYIPLLLATLTLANPAPLPRAALEPATLQPQPQARAAEAIPAEIVARTAGIILERSPKKSSSGSGNKNTTDTSDAGIVGGSRILQLAALGVGIVGVIAL